MKTDRKHIDKEIQVQKKIVRGLKKEIFGADKSWSSRYIRRFHSEFSAYSRISDTAEIIDAAIKSDIIYFGDYHPLDSSQEWVLYLLGELNKRGAKVVLALEMLYEYQQESLDRWMKGRYSEKEFLRKIDYESEWGFDWESYRRIFELARDPFVPIFGIDFEPRDQLRFIKRRDRMMARRISSIMDFFPGHIILTVAGESHLASKHLPHELRKVSGKDLRELVIVQNIDDIYWKLLQQGREDARSVLVGRNKYCVLTASPMVKYQSYRDIIEKWSDQPVTESVLTSLREMVDSISAILLGKGETLDVEVSGGLMETVEEVFPEVYCRKTYKSFSTLLRSRKITHKGILAIKENLKKTGLSYFPSLNIFLMLHFDRHSAAVEASRFVVYAVRGEMGPSRRARRGEEDRFYAYVIEEALAWTGARMIDPTLDAALESGLLVRTGPGDDVREEIKGLTLEETRELSALLKFHLRWEKNWRVSSQAKDRLKEIYRLGIRMRLHIIEALGRRLGEAVLLGYHEGKIRRRELLRLFGERFTEKGSGLKTYRKWVMRTLQEKDFNDGRK